ncbi:MAG: response regulator transcription factor [Actinomycetota bacterium]|nr:response regulator transcription factor [Actinomycetota bacterium]
MDKAKNKAMEKILIIEDEKTMAESISFMLEKEGYDVANASDGEMGWRLYRTGDYSLLILDLMLPSLDGFEILKRVREDGPMPVIILTAKDSEVDKVVGLEMGADDYVTKPFNMRELLARVKTILRRTSAIVEQKEPSVLEGGHVSVNLDRHQVKVRGEVVEIPLIEYKLLVLFLKNQGKVLSREYLLRAGWSGEFYGQTKSLDVYISRLRKKIEDDPSNPKLIVTVRGIGYRFEPQ